MELQQIRYFLAVVDFGTFLAASEQVHVSQPTLSAGIRKLEESLNVKLFNRGSRAATLTVAGELFLLHARQAYSQLLTVKSRLAAKQDKINVGVLNTLPMDHVAEILRCYKQACPHVFIELTVSNNEDLSQKLESNKLDLIFTSSHQVYGKFTMLFEEHLRLAVSSGNPLSNSSTIELNQLSDQPFIERINCESWADVHGLFQRHDIKPHSVCRAENDETVLALVAAGLGVSIMPVRDTPYVVKFVRIKDLNISRPIGFAISPLPHAPHVEELYQTTLKFCGQKAL